MIHCKVSFRRRTSVTRRVTSLALCSHSFNNRLDPTFTLCILACDEKAEQEGSGLLRRVIGEVIVFVNCVTASDNPCEDPREKCRGAERLRP